MIQDIQRSVTGCVCIVNRLDFTLFTGWRAISDTSDSGVSYLSNTYMY